MTENKLQLLDEFDWGTAIIKLTAYAISICSFRGKLLPKGLEAEDLVMNAIEKLYNGDRAWNPVKDPDLLRYLKSVIKSILSNETSSCDSKVLYVDEEILDSDPIFDSHLEEEIYCKDLDRNISLAMQGDPELCLVYKALKDGFRPAEIAEEYYIDIRAVRNAQKRLHRLAINVVHVLSKENHR